MSFSIPEIDASISMPSFDDFSMSMSGDIAWAVPEEWIILDDDTVTTVDEDASNDWLEDGKIATDGGSFVDGEFKDMKLK